MSMPSSLPNFRTEALILSPRLKPSDTEPQRLNLLGARRLRGKRGSAGATSP